jgi:hypothetical protein
MICTDTPEAPRWRRPAPSSIDTRSARRPLRCGVGKPGSVESSPWIEVEEAVEDGTQ